ncbi:MAG: aminoglycoside phosphotransferase family protein [Flavobacteriaceae bacterium]|nr:aminoglycoside phosphotransferase family protein [Flavobacteriaceae bacterium]
MVTATIIEQVFNQFKVASKFKSYQELNSGHINDTFLIKTDAKPYYVLQRINGNVFKKSQELIQNKVQVSNFLQQKYAHLATEELQKKVLCFAKSKHNTYFYKDAAGNYWNTSYYVEDSVTYHTPPNKALAFEAGKITGEFLEKTKDFDISKLTVIIPDFHSITKRYQQFEQALAKTLNTQKIVAKAQIDFVNAQLEEMLQIDKAIEAKEIPMRLTHNDTKISNILFSKNQEGYCLIDTDTVMPGVLHFDYADAIRTICNTANEDEVRLDKINFNFEYFKSYSKGFFSQLQNVSQAEKKYFPVSIKMMPFIMGLRFLTDYLNGNIYFKTAYQNHNLDRAVNQFTLVKKIDDCYQEIQRFLEQEM